MLFWKKCFWLTGVLSILEVLLFKVVYADSAFVGKIYILFFMLVPMLNSLSLSMILIKHFNKEATNWWLVVLKTISYLFILLLVLMWLLLFKVFIV